MKRSAQGFGRISKFSLDIWKFRISKFNQVWSHARKLQIGMATKSNTTARRYLDKTNYNCALLDLTLFIKMWYGSKNTIKHLQEKILWSYWISHP